MFPICLLFFFFPLQRKFILRRDDDRIKDIFILTWWSVGNIIVRPIVSLKGNHLVMKSRLLPSRLQRCDEAKQPCSLCKDVVGQQAWKQETNRLVPGVVMSLVSRSLGLGSEPGLRPETRSGANSGEWTRGGDRGDHTTDRSVGRVNIRVTTSLLW